MIPLGTRVCVIPRSEPNALWPAFTLVRFVGTLVAMDATGVLVDGQVQRWLPVPTPAPTDWPGRTVEHKAWPWSAPTSRFIPDEQAWRPTDFGSGTALFGLQTVAVFVLSPLAPVA